MNTTNTIGERIAVLRKSKGFTQEELASAIGVSAQSVSKWETGTTMPDILLLPVLADLFDVTVDALFGRTAEENRELSFNEVPEEAVNALLLTVQRAFVDKNDPEKPTPEKRAEQCRAFFAENPGSLVVIDEASMVTLEMMAALLSKVRHDCRIVLVGDPEQLGSVGSGDVLNDCLGLGFPCIRLKQNFRQTDKNAELFRNVDGFVSIRSEDQLGYDDSFRRAEPDERAVVEEALRHKQVQVISPFNNAVDRLNTELRGRFNPAAPEKREIWSRERVFRDGDRVLITKNNGALGCVNGDVGIFRIDDDDVFEPVYHVELDGNRCPQWWGYEGLENMTLAYAITVHRSQGSQYDVVLFYVPEEKSNLQRNLLYTAISRAKKQEILYCSRQTLDAAIRTPPRRRNSMLMDKAMAAFLELVA